MGGAVEVQDRKRQITGQEDNYNNYYYAGIVAVNASLPVQNIVWLIQEQIDLLPLSLNLLNVRER